MSEFIKDNIKYHQKDARSVTVGSGGSTAVVNGFNFTNLIIPKSVNGYFITEISSCAFERQTSLEYVTILAKIRKIHYHAFYHCPKLAVINIPSSVEFIGAGAISCINLNGTVGAGNIDIFFDFPSSLNTIDFLAMEQKESFNIYYGGMTSPVNNAEDLFKAAKSVKIYSPTAMKFNGFDTIGIGLQFFTRHVYRITIKSPSKLLRIPLAIIIMLCSCNP